MRKIVKFKELLDLNFVFDKIDCVEQCFRNRRIYDNYLYTPRPSSGIMLILSDMTLSFKESGKPPVNAKKGDIIYIPQGLYYSVTFHMIQPENRIDSYMVNFRLSYEEYELFFSNDIAIIGNTANSSVLSCIHSLSRAVHDIERNPLKIKAAFLLFLNSLIETADLSAKDFYPIRHGCALLQKEWNLNEKISKYAQACGISETYFNQLFKKWSGTTPVKYRNRIRISHAQTMLKDGNATVEEAAILTGFEDSFYFSRVFKSVTGVSPRNYKKL